MLLLLKENLTPSSDASACDNLHNQHANQKQTKKQKNQTTPKNTNHLETEPLLFDPHSNQNIRD
jgi:hypothetical protein